MVNWIRNYISRYAEVLAPFQTKQAFEIFTRWKRARVPCRHLGCEAFLQLRAWPPVHSPYRESRSFVAATTDGAKFTRWTLFLQEFAIEILVATTNSRTCFQETCNRTTNACRIQRNGR